MPSLIFIASVRLAACGRGALQTPVRERFFSPGGRGRD
jgi:hypothetical protein